MTTPRRRKATAAPASPAHAQPTPAQPDNGPGAEPRRPRKREIVHALLSRTEGASTAELMAATGWQAHTVRAHLSMLRKDGEVITRAGRGETMRYVLKDPR